MRFHLFSVVFLVLGWVTPSGAGTITGTVTFLEKAKNEAAVHLEGVGGKGRSASGINKNAMMVQRKQLFVPEVLPVFKGTTVNFPNKDTVFHNAFSMTPGNMFDLGTYGPGKNPNVTLETPGKVDIFCNMHHQMHAVALVFDHPFFTLTSKKGEYAIKGVPAGSYTIKAWAGSSIVEEKTVNVGANDTVTVDFNIGNK
ncbi:MAG TPA: carboxypeptidase regulatory-like domain-containing protein [Nitrospiria bacterium]